MRKTLAAALALLALGLSPAFAQNRTSLNIQCNEVGAEVYINGRLAGQTTPNFSFLIPQGNVQVRVQKNGFRTFETVVRAGTTPVNLQVTLVRIGAVPPPPPPPQNFSLQVTANVAGAEIVINNVTAGRAPFSAVLAPGSYTLIVRAPGFTDFSQNLVIAGPTVVNAVLHPLMVPLTLGNLRPGAEVFLNGARVGVATSTVFTIQVAPGVYTVTIRLAGFLDFTTQMTAGAAVPQTIAPVFQPLPASFTFVIPEGIQNPDVRGNPWGQIRLFIDGAAQREFRGQVQPGRRTIRLVTGAFAIETTFDFEAGRSYTFEPFLGLNIR
ncbi:MAG TPA: PEGA domain-containing protein [Magnetospirillaceae bacterium]|nr:PEGA domain-containing protein [Magnetospirillaceae bacterium]